MINNISQKIACKHKWFKHAIETGSMTVLRYKTNKNFISLLGNQHRILMVSKEKKKLYFLKS